MPNIRLPKKAQLAMESKAMYVVLYGGRGSAKSNSVARIKLLRCQTEQADILCGREFQNSISDSVHKLFKSIIQDPDHDIHGFDITKHEINCDTGGCFRFKGFNRDPKAVKSAEDFKYCWAEEADALSGETIETLLPTIRGSGSQIWFSANPQHSEDPFSKRFIVPFMDKLDKNGIYEDDMHFICKMNYKDNPFWNREMEMKRVWDKEHMTPTKYEWIWEGAFNDSVENALIMHTWFDACIDAHVKLGFSPKGAKFASHDPSDIGPDDKAFALRHGSVFTIIERSDQGDVNEGCDWALSLAMQNNADSFIWDCDGLGVGLNRQVSKAFEGKHTVVSQFKGSESPDNPENVCDFAEHAAVHNQKKIKDAIKNKRAQRYLDLRNRIYRTWEAVEKGIYHDPDKLISFSSDIRCMNKLRSELTRMPIKPNSNGLFELYTKQDMKSKFKFPSPNLADVVMMNLDTPVLNNAVNQTFWMPQPIRSMGTGIRSCR